MCKVLVVDKDIIDRQMAHSVLSGSRGSSFSVFSADSDESALSVLDSEAIDLMIADVPSSNTEARYLVQAARMRKPDISVILTSVIKEAELSYFVAKLNVDGYLLKPFRAEKLLELATKLSREKDSAATDTVKDALKSSLERLEAAINSYSYKQCLDISKEYVDGLFESSAGPDFIRSMITEYAEGIAEIGREFSHELYWKLSACFDQFRSRFDLLNSCFQVNAFFVEMIELFFAEMEQKSLYFDDALKKVLNYIDRNISKNISLDSAANYINMSSCYFSKYFRRGTGVNFKAYIIERKMELAKEMLAKTDMPIINITYALAYSDANYFSKVFRKNVGMSPTQYREQYAS